MGDHIDSNHGRAYHEAERERLSKEAAKNLEWNNKPEEEKQAILEEREKEELLKQADELESRLAAVRQKLEKFK